MDNSQYLVKCKKENTKRHHVLEGYKMPFSLFLHELKEMVGEIKPINHPGGYLCQYPVYEAIAAGLVAMANSVAKKKYDLNIETPADIALVAKHIDRMINIGIILRFASPKKAAKYFAHEVCVSANSASDSLSVPFHVFLRRKSAEFFAALYKEAREYLEGIKAHFEELCLNPKFGICSVTRSREPKLVQLFNKSGYYIFWQDVIDLLFLDTTCDPFETFRLQSGKSGKNYFQYFFRVLPGLLPKITKLRQKFGGYDETK